MSNYNSLVSNTTLVEIVNNQVVVSSRMVAERFGKRHVEVLDAIRSIERCVENSTELFKKVELTDSYGRLQPAYLMNRDGFSLLAMGFTGSDALEWKLKYIKAFNAMEAELNKPKETIPTLPTSFAEALRLAADQAEQLELARPKVEFVDTYVEKGVNCSIRELGKRLGKKPNKFQAQLRKDGYLMSDNMPYQVAINKGLFTVRTVTESGFRQTMATPKAITYFAQKYKDWGSY